MSSGEVVIVCSDRGQHGEHELGRLRLADDGTVHDVKLRQAPAVWGKGATLTAPDDEQRHALGPRVAVEAPSTRDDYAGRPRRRHKCSVCKRDVPWNEATTVRYVQGAVRAGLRVLDVSLLPE